MWVEWIQNDESILEASGWWVTITHSQLLALNCLNYWGLNLNSNAYYVEKETNKTSGARFYLD
jgi:hypothetical protein